MSIDNKIIGTWLSGLKVFLLNIKNLANLQKELTISMITLFIVIIKLTKTKKLNNCLCKDFATD